MLTHTHTHTHTGTYTHRHTHVHTHTHARTSTHVHKHSDCMEWEWLPLSNVKLAAAVCLHFPSNEMCPNENRGAKVSSACNALREETKRWWWRRNRRIGDVLESPEGYG